MENPLVSVLVVSYNRKDDLARCLLSIRRLTYSPFETVVLDNGSQDGSAEMIERDFPEVRLIKMPKNYGDWEGRDIACMNCRGELLFSMDDDAEAQPDTLTKLVRRMQLEPELAVVQAKILDPASGSVKQTGYGLEMTSRNHYMANFIGCAVLLRMRALLAAGGFPHYLLGGAEAHLTYRFLDMGYRILYLSEATIYHRMSAVARVPYQRSFLSSKQRLRAVMNHFPGRLRLLFELCCKLWSYSVEALSQGFLLHLPTDLVRLTYAGLKACKSSWRIKPKTLHLIDYLRCHAVTSIDEYEHVPQGQSQLLLLAKRRITGGRSSENWPTDARPTRGD